MDQLSRSFHSARVALVHDWLTGMRGGEYVLEAIAELFPQAELFTLLYVEDKVSPRLAALKRHTSALQRIPGAQKRYRHFLPWMPRLIESFDLSGYDLVISSSHCVAKGIRKAPGAIHVSYTYTPMRYMWDLFDEYFGPGRSSMPVRVMARAVRGRLQRWDRKTSQVERVDSFATLSHFIAQRMKTIYNRSSQVIYPFADLTRFLGQPRNPGPYYLMVGAFAPYKRVDLAIAAFNQMKLPLWIVGGGQDEKKLHALAGPSIRFLGKCSNEEIAGLYAKCRAFIFPGVEDFGITPLEAMASGAPVIAYGVGGAAETVTEKSGLFFEPQTPEGLVKAVSRFESGAVKFSEDDCRAQAAKFTREEFQQRFFALVLKTWTASGRSSEALPCPKVLLPRLA